MTRAVPTVVALVALAACGTASITGGADVAEGVYVFASVYRGSDCIDIGSENVSETDDNLHRNACNSTGFQKWTVRRDPSRASRYLIDWSQQGDKYWTAEDHAQGAEYVTWERRRDTAFQSWMLEDQGNGRMRIKNDGNGRCIDYSSSESGPNLRLANCNTAAEQLWTMGKQ
jgi:hypothetical protein